MTSTSAAALSPAHRVVRSESSAGESTPDDYLILDLFSGRYYSVGSVGGFVWTRIEDDRMLSQIAADVAQEFDVDGERATADVLDFTTELLHLGLIERVEIA